MVIITMADLYHGDQATIAHEDIYVKAAVALAGEGNDVTLTGPGPVWLYLIVAHALHGLARTLWYDSKVTGGVLIFSHDPR